MNAREGGFVVFYCVVIFSFATSNKYIITTLDLSGNIYIPRWGRAISGEGFESICDIDEIREKIYPKKGAKESAI